MKNLFLTLFVCASFCSIRAQELKESFETWPPEAWSFYSDFGTGSWVQSALDEENAPKKIDGNFAAKLDYGKLAFVKLNMTSETFDISSLKNPELSFQWYRYNSLGDRSLLEIYVSYNGTDFVLLETIKTDVNLNDWKTYSRLLNRNVKKVRLRGIKDHHTCKQILYVDNFSIAEGEACAYPLDLSYIFLPSVNGRVQFSWNTSHDENKWKLKISSRPINPKLEEADVLSVEILDKKTYIAENLKVGETYYWYMQGICDEMGSKWVEGKTFTLGYAPVQVPFTLDFEEHDANFTYIQDGQLNQWHRGYMPYGTDTNTCFYVSSDKEKWEYSNQKISRSYLCRDIVFPEYAPNGFEISFDFMGMGQKPNHSMEVYISLNMDYYPTAGSFVDVLNTNEVGDEYCNNAEWTLYKKEISADYAGKNARLIISWRNNDYQEKTDPPAAFDNFSILPLECPLPKNLHITEQTHHSLGVSWDTIQGITKKWQIEYGPFGFAPGTGTLVETEVSPFILKDAEACTRYDFIIKAYCGDSENKVLSEPSSRLHAISNCFPEQAPYFTNFDDLTEEQYPLGWTYITKDSLYKPYVLSSDYYAKSQPNSMILNGGRGDLNLGIVSPEFSDLSLQNKRIRFDARIFVVASLEVGVLKSPDEPQSFILLRTIEGKDFVDYNEMGQPIPGMFRHTLNLTDSRITEEYKHVCIRIKDGAPMKPAAVDNFMYEEIPSCIEPTGLRPVDIDITSARITWVVQGSENNWEVICGEGSFEPNIEDEGIKSDQEIASFENLKSGTFYRAYVRSVCSDTSKGPWSDAFLFKTCSAGEMPLMENFDMVNSFKIPLCWQVRDEKSLWSIDKKNSYSPPYSISYPINQVKSNDWLFTPALAFKKDTKYRVSFRAKKLQKKEAVLRIKYGKNPDPESMIEFVGEYDSIGMEYGMLKGFFAPPSNGTYYVGIQYESVVSSGISIDDFGLMVSGPLSVEESNQKTWKVYPNPAENQIQIDLGSIDMAHILIYGIKGERLKEIANYRSKSPISLEGIKSGFCIVQIISQGNSSIQKIIIK